MCNGVVVGTSNTLHRETRNEAFRMVHAVPSIPWSCPSKRKRRCLPPSSRPSRVSMCIHLQTFHVFGDKPPPSAVSPESLVPIPHELCACSTYACPTCRDGRPLFSPGVLMSQVWTTTFVSLRGFGLAARRSSTEFETEKETGSPRGNGRDAPGSCRVAHGARHEGGTLHVSHFVCLNQAGGGTDRSTSGLDGPWSIDTVSAVQFKDPGH